MTLKKTKLPDGYSFLRVDGIPEEIRRDKSAKYDWLYERLEEMNSNGAAIRFQCPDKKKAARVRDAVLRKTAKDKKESPPATARRWQAYVTVANPSKPNGAYHVYVECLKANNN